MQNGCIQEPRDSKKPRLHNEFRVCHDLTGSRNCPFAKTAPTFDV